MEKMYSEQIKLRAPQCDIHGQWRPGAIMEAMQETATTHCERVGMGRDMTDAMGIVWVLTRARVSMRRLPKAGETVTVQTWPQTPKHMFYPRINAFLDADGGEIGSATSLWVLMDIHTRHIVNSDAILARIPDNSDLPAGIPLGAVRPLAGEAAVAELLPPYADFDLNGHVNNTKYMDWACNALGHEALAQNQLMSFAINYDAEVLPGIAVRTELTRDGDRFGFCGYEGSKRCFCVVGTLQRR